MLGTGRQGPNALLSYGGFMKSRKDAGRNSAGSVARLGRSSLEQLEPRWLMAAQDVVIGAGAAKSVQFNDANGTAVMVHLAGPGTATVSFSGDNFSQTANSRGVVL